MAVRCCYALVAVYLQNFQSEQGVFNLFFVRWAKNIHIENQHFIKKITNK